ncbi:hypothetical protein GR197_19805 [Rhizobium phaseoli]|uniref:DUF4350 domain-containing protein n=1 Tax=Rhizobium phaseoli TaxID=396 RepID=A0A7K3UGF7_9HYPH|nr:hypothetical protein [Rhizobium phaseoli]NEJ72756.1 hypothetical protein [Rhizobium phaseoli]
MRKSAPVLILVLVLGLAALALFWLPRDDDYDYSPLGSKGLQVWLEAKGIAIVRSNAHVTKARSQISLRILSLPLSKDEAGAPRDKAAAPGADEQTGEAGLESWSYEAINHELPTLITMPKWRGSVLKDGVARQSDLVALADIHEELDKIDPLDFRLDRYGPDFEQAQPSLEPGQPVKIALYEAQTFDRESLPRRCHELAGMPSGALIVQCEDNPFVYLLSDPDLLNNHGLALADNAAFAVSLIQHLRGAGETRPVYLDTAGQPLDSEKPVDEGKSYERSGSDLQRFFAYPLSIIWGMLLVVAAICFWRGACRFGPPLREASANIELSKTAAIEATARLLRLSGNDGRMAGQFVLHLLADKAQLLFGSGAGNQAGIARLFQRLARRDKAGAQALHAAAEALIERGHVMTRADLHRHLEIFRKLLGSIELGSR